MANQSANRPKYPGSYRGMYTWIGDGVRSLSLTSIPSFKCAIYGIEKVRESEEVDERGTFLLRSGGGNNFKELIERGRVPWKQRRLV